MVKSIVIQLNRQKKLELSMAEAKTVWADLNMFFGKKASDVPYQVRPVAKFSPAMPTDYKVTTGQRCSSYYTAPLGDNNLVSKIEPEPLSVEDIQEAK